MARGSLDKFAETTSDRRVAAFRLVTGLFLAYGGARGLLVPHEANQVAVAGLAHFAPTLESYLILQALLRVVMLIAGLGLLAAELLPRTRSAAVAMHGTVLLALGSLVVVLVGSGAFAAASLAVALTIGTVVSLLYSLGLVWSWLRNRDVLMLVITLASIPVGVILLAIPETTLGWRIFPAARSLLPWFGACIVVGGGAQIAAALRPAVPRWVAIGGQVLVVGGWIVWSLLTQFPVGFYSGGIGYTGFILLLLAVLLLWPRLPRFDMSALRARVTIVLTAAMAIPIFIGLGIVSNYQEYVERENELQGEQAQATAMSEALSVELAHVADIARALAVYQDVAAQPAAASVLDAVISTDDDLVGAMVLDPAGNVVRRTGGLPEGVSVTQSTSWVAGFDNSTLAVVEVAGSAPIVLVVQPIRRGVDPPTGMLAVAVSFDVLRDRLMTASTIRDAHVYVVDDRGRLLIDTGQPPRPVSADLAALPPVHALLGGLAPTALAYTPGGEVMAGVASVSPTGWGVVSERSATAALAVGRSSRELAFIVVLVVVNLAALVGRLTAQFLTTPLARLAESVRHVAQGDAIRFDVSRSGIREVSDLTDDFADMQLRLNARQAAERAARAEAESARLLAESALRSRDYFLASLAHDLKTPVVNLLWLVQLMGRQAAQPRPMDTGTLIRATQSVAEAASEISSAIDELHDLTRLQAGALLPLNSETVDLSDLVTTAVAARRAVDRQHPITIEAPDSSLEIQGDRGRLNRVLANLLDNAAKYSPRGSPITVSLASEVEAGATWAVLQVRDSGAGIAADDLPYIFERFFRGANSERVPGEGLGLVSVRQVVELHGGTVAASSEVGAGSLFVVRLPVSSPRPDER
jgi:signal transduction histidine kinase